MACKSRRGDFHRAWNPQCKKLELNRFIASDGVCDVQQSQELMPVGMQRFVLKKNRANFFTVKAFYCIGSWKAQISLPNLLRVLQMRLRLQPLALQAVVTAAASGGLEALEVIARRGRKEVCAYHLCSFPLELFESELQRTLCF